MLIIVALTIITAIIIIKYNPVYEVTFNGEVIGYIKNQAEFEEDINSKVLVCDNPCALFTELNSELTYTLKLADIKETNEDEILQKLSQNTTTMYRVYAIALEDEVKAYVNTVDEATQIVEEMKSEYSNSIEVNISVTEKYTNNLEEVGVVELAEAETAIDGKLRIIRDEQEKIAAATCNGVYLSVKPVSGTITSRYGAVESIRDHVHGGLDIAAPAGTPIKATAGGTVSYSGWMSGYGYLVIIDHENGVQTYYGHCSKLYVSKGEEVEAGDKIAAVGSTGNSTGNHLHFEIRVNGTRVNPQDYMYNN